MPLTDVQIGNLALLHIANTKFILSMDERTQAAQTVSLVYEHAVEMTLEAYPWPEATKYATLGLIQADPNDDWDYEYQYPGDCLSVRRIVTTLGREDPNPPPYMTGNNGSTRVIYTDESPAVIEYTCNLTDTALFRPTLAQAISWFIAFSISGVAKDKRISQYCYQVWRSMVSMAEARAGNEQQLFPDQESEFIRSRA